MIIANMKPDAPRRELQSFGEWLKRELRARRLNQAEFAELTGVGTSTVSRWVNGRVPEAALLERIADVLVVDYDELATRAGFRPRGLDAMDPGSPEAILMPYIRRIQWTEERIDTAKAMLNQMIQFDERKK